MTGSLFHGSLQSAFNCVGFHPLCTLNNLFLLLTWSSSVGFCGYCWWFRNPVYQRRCSLSQYLWGFTHPRSCRISSTNSISNTWALCSLSDFVANLDRIPSQKLPNQPYLYWNIRQIPTETHGLKGCKAKARTTNYSCQGFIPSCPYHPCMVYLYTHIWWIFLGHLGKYTVRPMDASPGWDRVFWQHQPARNYPQ